MSREKIISCRVHPKLWELVEQQAHDLDTTVSWIIEATLADRFRDQLPPGFTPGMPHKDRE